MPNQTHCDECGGPCAECDCVESPISPLTQQVLAGHLALCQGQRESVNQMAAAARKDVHGEAQGQCGAHGNHGGSSPPTVSGYQAPPAATLNESLQQSPALENISAQSCSPAPALLPLNREAVFQAKVIAVESADRFVDEKERITIRVEGCDICFRELRLVSPWCLGPFLDERYELVLRRASEAGVGDAALNLCFAAASKDTPAPAF